MGLRVSRFSLTIRRMKYGYARVSTDDPPSFVASVPRDFLIVKGSANKWGEGERLSPHPTINYFVSEHRKSLPGLAPVALPFSNVSSPLHMIQRYPVDLCTSRVLLFGGISFATSGALTPSFSRS